MTTESLSKELGERIARHMERMFREGLSIADPTLDEAFFRLITGEPHPFGNMAFLNVCDDVSVTERAVSPLVESGFPSAVIYLADVSDSVSQWLTQNGFANAGSMPAMAVDIDQLAPTRVAEGYRFQRIYDAESDAWTDALAEGYGLPRSVAHLFSPVAMGGAKTEEEAQYQWFALYKGDKIVSVSMLALADDLAGIYAVATLADERGKGLGAHGTAEPLRLAAKCGYRIGLLQASDDGYPVYQRLGFKDFGGLPLFVRLPQ